jgi:hypothetical protein
LQLVYLGIGGAVNNLVNRLLITPSAESSIPQNTFAQTCSSVKT